MVYKFVLFVLIIAPFSAQPHSGRTNAEGCHTDKMNNDYHCHNEVDESVPSRADLPPLPENYATSFSNKNLKPKEKFITTIMQLFIVSVTLFLTI